MSKYNEVLNRKRKHREKKKLFILTGAAIAIVVVFLFVLLVGGSKNDKLVGIWKYDQYTEYEFFEDGSGCLCVDDVHYEYTYKISRDKLKLDFTEDVVRDCEYKFVVKNNNLTLIGGEGTDKGTYELKKITKH